MMLTYNSKGNDTVLIALMEGGVLASFKIETNYTQYEQKETINKISKSGN